MKYNFRAWYIPDMDDEPIKFELRDVYGQMEFVSPNDDVFYSMGLVFADEDWLVEQYTGTKDKNGKEIYVGDIVKYNHDWEVYAVKDEIEVVQFENGGFSPMQFTNGGTYYGLKSDPVYEVIGNVHENKELKKNQYDNEQTYIDMQHNEELANEIIGENNE